MFLSDISIKRPVFATMMMLALVVIGVVGYKRLAVDEYPDVTYPIISVQASYPGASPEVVERDVSVPSRPRSTRSRDCTNSRPRRRGGGNVRLQFKLGVDPTKMQPEVSAKVGRIRRSLAARHDGAHHHALRPQRPAHPRRRRLEQGAVAARAHRPRGPGHPSALRGGGRCRRRDAQRCGQAARSTWSSTRWRCGASG